MTNGEELKAKLNLETGKLAWQELERFFAKGSVIHVNQELDLVETAALIALDQKQQIAELMASNKISRPDMEQAGTWHQDEQVFWAVVVSPWVLIQEVST